MYYEMSRFKKIYLETEQERSYKKFTGMRLPKDLKAEPVASVIKLKVVDSDPRTKKIPGARSKGKLWS